MGCRPLLKSSLCLYLFYLSIHLCFWSEFWVASSSFSLLTNRIIKTKKIIIMENKVPVKNESYKRASTKRFMTHSIENVSLPIHQHCSVTKNKCLLLVHGMMSHFKCDWVWWCKWMSVWWPDLPRNLVRLNLNWWHGAMLWVHHLHVEGSWSHAVLVREQLERNKAKKSFGVF